MNTPSNKRYSSASEYGTPHEIEEEDRSLYFSFSADDNPSNKENSIIGGQWAITELTPSMSSTSSKAKTPLLRKVLQSNFTPRNVHNKRVSFSHLPKQNPIEENAGKIAKSAHVYEHEINSNTMFDLDPIREAISSSVSADQTIFDEHNNEQDANDVIDDENDDTIIENPTSMKHSPESLAKDSKQSESTACGLNGVKKSVEIKDLLKEKKVSSKVSTRNATKIDRKRLVEENRKSVLPVAKKKPMRSTTYKRRSSTYEPRKVTLSKSVSGTIQYNRKCIIVFYCLCFLIIGIFSCSYNQRKAYC